MSQPNLSPVAISFGASVGGFVYGVLGGFSEGLEWFVSLHLGAMCLIAGAISGVLGFYVFKWVPSSKLFASIVRIGTIGSVFMALRFFLINTYVPAFNLAGNLTIAAIGGALGGAFAGFLMWLYKSK